MGTHQPAWGGLEMNCFMYSNYHHLSPSPYQQSSHLEQGSGRTTRGRDEDLSKFPVTVRGNSDFRTLQFTRIISLSRAFFEAAHWPGPATPGAQLAGEESTASMVAHKVNGR